MNDLAGKTALVTGGSRGIGRACALALAEAGTRVIVHFGSDEDRAFEVVEEIRAAGGAADAIRADLGESDGAHALAALVRERVGKRLDILVANAGINIHAPIEETTVAEFDRLFAVNVRAPFFLLQQLLPILGEGSSIVFLSSFAAHGSANAQAAYAATKGAIDTLVTQFAHALGERGIRVNAIAPGVVSTDMSASSKTEEGREAIVSMQALKRVAEPRDIAAAVAFLASDNARWITGDTIKVDGGLRLYAGLGQLRPPRRSCGSRRRPRTRLAMGRRASALGLAVAPSGPARY